MNTLRELDAAYIPMITILNKMDKIASPANLKQMVPEFQDGLLLSALHKTNLENLETAVNKALFENYIPIEVSIPYKSGKLISEFHEFGSIDRIDHGIGEVKISGRIPGRLVADFARFKKKKDGYLQRK